MNCYIRCGCVCLFILAVVAACAAAAEPAAAKKKAAEPAKAAPATRTMKKGPLKIIVDLNGVFEGETVHQIVVKPEEWTTLTV